MSIKNSFSVTFLAAAAVAVFLSVPLSAQGLNVFKNFGKSVEADPNKEYVLTETSGPYLIFATSFSGPAARQNADALVLDFRKNFKWEAYVFEKTFNRDASKEFTPAPNPYFKTKYQYLNSKPDAKFAVFIGNFLSQDDKQFEKVLAEVRKCRPDSMKNIIKSDVPFALAFGLANPMLPPENPQGYVDSFVESINIKRPYTLLRNPRRYTVQIASFRGGNLGYSWRDTANVALDAGKPANNMSKLEKGEMATVSLCKTLRERGVDAYEFYDRYSSYVTVGSFNHYGISTPDGRVVTDPQIQQIIKQYQGEPVIIDGKKKFKPVVIDGIVCDPNPKVIEVPRVRRIP